MSFFLPLFLDELWYHNLSFWGRCAKVSGWKIGGRGSVIFLNLLHASLKVKLSWAAVTTLDWLPDSEGLPKTVPAYSFSFKCPSLWGRESAPSTVLKQRVPWQGRTGLDEYLRNHQYLNIDLRILAGLEWYQHHSNTVIWKSSTGIRTKVSWCLFDCGI